jgi:hypothetical protein
MALTGGPLHAKLAHQDDEQQVYTRKAGKPNAMLGVAAVAVAELVLSRQPSATHERREEPSTPPTHHENRSLAGDTPLPNPRVKQPRAGPPAARRVCGAVVL